MTKKVDFEKNLNELEEMVQTLEGGELNLEESIKNFESGVKLYNSCKKYLQDVEKKVSILTESLEEKDMDA